MLLAYTWSALRQELFKLAPELAQRLELLLLRMMPTRNTFSLEVSLLRRPNFFLIIFVVPWKMGWVSYRPSLAVGWKTHWIVVRNFTIALYAKPEDPWNKP